MIRPRSGEKYRVRLRANTRSQRPGHFRIEFRLTAAIRAIWARRKSTEYPPKNGGERAAPSTPGDRRLSTILGRPRRPVAGCGPRRVFSQRPKSPKNTKIGGGGESERLRLPSTRAISLRDCGVARAISEAGRNPCIFTTAKIGEKCENRGGGESGRLPSADNPSSYDALYECAVVQQWSAPREVKGFVRPRKTRWFSKKMAIFGSYFTLIEFFTMVAVDSRKIRENPSSFSRFPRRLVYFAHTRVSQPSAILENTSSFESGRALRV